MKRTPISFIVMAGLLLVLSTIQVGYADILNVSAFTKSIDPPGPPGPWINTDNMWEEMAGGEWVFAEPSLMQNYAEDVSLNPLTLTKLMPNGVYDISVIWYKHGTDNTQGGSFAITVEGQAADMVWDYDSDTGYRTTYIGQFTVADGTLDIMVGDANAWDSFLNPSSNWFAFSGFDFAAPILPDGSIEGTIDLQDYTGDKRLCTFQAQFRQPGTGTVLRTDIIHPDENGHYSIAAVSVGTYDIVFRASTWLQALVSSVTVNSEQVTTVNPSLKNGDINGDNSITILDFGIMKKNWGKSGD